MEYSAIPVAHSVVALCKSYGIHQVVISPGSRNAPLTLGFTSDPAFECFSIVDERSAAFFAMGLTQQSGVPTALVCTSGSALLNYYPAISEAYYSRIPLIVLSADRPPYKIDIGDGQTIRQDGVFDRHIGYSASLLQDPDHATSKIRWPEGAHPDSHEAMERLVADRRKSNADSIHRAVKTAVQEQLPVHLNIPMEEPLYNMVSNPPYEPESGHLESVEMPAKLDEHLLRIWEQSDRICIMAGVLPPHTLSVKVVDWLGSDPSVMVLTETTSNLDHTNFFPSIDSIMAPLELQSDKQTGFSLLQPELLITIGGMIVSKKIKQFLRDNPPKYHWHIDPLEARDTFYCLDTHIQQKPEAFFLGLMSSTLQLKTSNYRLYWDDIRRQYVSKRKAYAEKIPFSDFKACDILFSHLPDSITVHLANSSTVRYAQLFDRKPGQEVFCNRGTSGIDGSTSTAVGASQNSEKPTVLISGDLSFLYDSNALWNAYLRKDFRIIVIHNSGGGIFRILPGYRTTSTFATFFETVHHRSLRPLCEMHGLDYYKADDAQGLEAIMQDFFEPSEKPALLEIQTPREINDRILLSYFDFLS